MGKGGVEVPEGLYRSSPLFVASTRGSGDGDGVEEPLSP
ncbi:hypothetical protein U9M48_025533, partial [Paspalum notatum var. saurae]